jgi:hypothetical protein
VPARWAGWAIRTADVHKWGAAAKNVGVSRYRPAMAIQAYVFVSTTNPGPRAACLAIRRQEGVVRADALLGGPHGPHRWLPAIVGRPDRRSRRIGARGQWRRRDELRGGSGGGDFRSWQRRRCRLSGSDAAYHRLGAIPGVTRRVWCRWHPIRRSTRGRSRGRFVRSTPTMCVTRLPTSGRPTGWSVGQFRLGA